MFHQDLHHRERRLKVPNRLEQRRFTAVIVRVYAGPTPDQVLYQRTKVARGCLHQERDAMAVSPVWIFVGLNRRCLVAPFDGVPASRIRVIAGLQPGWIFEAGLRGQSGYDIGRRRWPQGAVDSKVVEGLLGMFAWLFAIVIRKSKPKIKA